MPARCRLRPTWLSLIVAIIGWWSQGLSADDSAATGRPVVSAESSTFGLQYSVQPGNTLLAPTTPDARTYSHHPEPDDLILQAAYFEAAVDFESVPAAPPAKLQASPAHAPEADSPSGTSLFGNSAGDEPDHWSTTLDAQAEDRVDSAIRAAGFAIVVLGVVLVAFLGWHRLKTTQLAPVSEAAELSERGRLPITQTCRLHLVRAGTCDVLVAVDRGAVRAMTPLPADFSQLTSLAFDESTDDAANGPNLRV